MAVAIDLFLGLEYDLVKDETTRQDSISMVVMANVSDRPFMVTSCFLVAFVGAELDSTGVVTMLVMLKIGPLRELVMKGLEQVNMGRGLATVKTIAMRMAVILLQVLQAF
ncbi:hypothetical protein Sjap_008933 [Stephania japonica]|uniref:Uncharacterized protein n=1 Tax=Stephania japonica TaxID=461633 RepID=A0AAP0PCV0_9MAGN